MPNEDKPPVEATSELNDLLGPYPDWNDRITARSGYGNEVIVRVPNAEGAVNHSIRIREAVRLSYELQKVIGELLA